MGNPANESLEHIVPALFPSTEILITEFEKDLIRFTESVQGSQTEAGRKALVYFRQGVNQQAAEEIDRINKDRRSNTGQIIKSDGVAEAARDQNKQIGDSVLNPLVQFLTKPMACVGLFYHKAGKTLVDLYANQRLTSDEFNEIIIAGLNPQTYTKISEN